MNEHATTLLVMSLYGLTLAVWLLPPLARMLRELWRQYAAHGKSEAAAIAVFFLYAVYVGGTKPTNTESQAQSGGVTNTVAIIDDTWDDGTSTEDSGQPYVPESEPPRLTSNQYAAGFALLPRAYTNAAWLSLPSNAVVHAPWTRYGLAEDTFWLPATNWAFLLGANAVEGAHVSSSGTLSFDPATPKGSPRARAMPDGDTLNFLAPLQASLGTVPPEGRFWHAVTPSNSVLMTWQDLYAGRDTNSPVTFQAELFAGGDFVYRYAFTNALTLTNFVIGAQHNGGGETYALNDTNLLANGLELRWRWFGMLDPDVDDHDGDGVSTYDEVMTHDSDPSMPDTDLDGLGDAQEDPAAGPYPRVRDSDGDGLIDGSDPDPMHAGSLADLDGDGLPDAWEVWRFGGTNVTGSADADTNGDGFSDRVNMLTGTDPALTPPPGFAVTNAAAVAGIDAWEIAPAFALDMQTGLTNILTRTIQISRTSPWQQYFVSADPRSAASWALDGLKLQWTAGTNVSGSATASPAGDSMRLAVSSNLMQSATFRLTSTRTSGLLISAQPLYLVRWTPQPAFQTGDTVAAVTSSNGTHYVAALLESGNSAALPFTLNAAVRPQKAAPGQDELSELAQPPDPESAAYPVYTSGLGAGHLTAPEPAEAWLPACGTNAAIRVLLYKLEIVYGGGIEADRPLGQYSEPYPLDSSALRSKWRNNAIATGSLDPNTFTVLTGVDPDILRIRINGEYTDTYTWPSGGSSMLISGQSLMAMSALQEPACDCEYGVPLEVMLSDSNILDRCENREPTDHDSSGGGEPEQSGTDDKCGCGDADGGGLGSLKFRISLGSAGRDRISGFLWFAMETPQPVSASVFNILGDPNVTAATNAGTVTVTCPEVNGRTLVIEGIADGVLISVKDAGDALEHKWRITTPSGDTNTVCLVKLDTADNAVSDETYAYNIVNGQWTRTDNLTAATETLVKIGSPSDGTGQSSTRTLTAGGVILSKVQTVVAAVGDGENAVGRETSRHTWDGVTCSYLSRFSIYWADSYNAKLNGLLRLRYGNEAPWEYHAYDVRGRETLSAGPLDGSSYCPDMMTRDDLGTASALAALQNWPCTATEYAYTPDLDAGDSNDPEDSRKPRTVTAYVIRNGTATVVSREWRVYTRQSTNNYASLVTRIVRAASATAAFNDAANAVSTFESYAGSESLDVKPSLWNLPLREEREDGSVTTWAYELGGYSASSGVFTPGAGEDYLQVTSRSGTIQHPDGITGLSTYTVEIRDAASGRTLATETRLHTGGSDPVLSWEKMAYDLKGHMLVAEYSDGTCESNIWDCCHLLAKIGRDGSRTEYLSVPGDSRWSGTGDVSMGGLPGAEGRYPSAEAFTDAIGRETNSVRCVRYNGSRDNSYAPLYTRTEYTYGTDNCRVTTDPFGVQAVFTRSYPGNADTETSASAGVTNTATTVWGGATTAEKTWSDPVSGECLSIATRTSKDWDANGCATESVSERRNGGAWMTRSVTARNFLGRETAASQAGHGGTMLVTSNTYDSAGRTVTVVGSDCTRTVYAYGELGEAAGTVRIGAGQQLSFDPQNFTLAAVIAMNEYAVTETPAWKEYGDLGLASNGVQQAWWDCSATVLHNPGRGAVTTSVQRVQLTGLSAACVKRTVATDISGAATITTESLEAGDARTSVTSVNTATAASAASVSVAGVQVSATNSIGSATSYTFDGFARQVTATETADSRTLQRATGYHSDGSVAFSAEICGTVSNVTSYSERQYLQQPEGAYTVTATDAMGSGTVNYFSGDGTLYRSGGAVYPTATARDVDGRQAELKTWRDESGNPDTTRWHYDCGSGLVTNKVYAFGKGPAYAYKADGRMLSRTWARGTVTEYGYADTEDGSAMTVDYGDGTPAISNGYNLAGQLVYVSDGTGGRTLSYNSKGQQTAETNSLAAINRNYDGQGRDAGYVLNLAGFSADTFSVSYGHDEASRIDCVTSVFNGVTNTFRYSFLPGTALVSGMTNSAGQGWTRTYEPGRNLINAVSNFWNGAAVSSFGYENDAAGRRTLRLDAAPSLSATNVFAYNQRSEVTNAAMGSANYSYSFDDIGNRKWATAGSSLNTYAANALNQYVVVTNAGISLPVGYDLDGNMTVNGEWLYDWDGENNLWLAQQVVQTNGSLQVENGYDYLKRRWYKRVDVLTGQEPPSGSPPMPGEPGMWVPSKTTYYVWEGWNIVAEITIEETLGTTNVTRYVWGLDLSGSIQGAGGVGGLLAVIEDNGNVYFPCYDANGNITEYLDETGTVRAHRVFDAFGNTTAKSGDRADNFRFWFSTKYLDSETGNYVYQQRQYIPPLGRWASRDPQSETDYFNLYAFVHNATISDFDVRGLDSWKLRAIALGCRDAIVVPNGNKQTITGGEARPTKWNVSPTKRRNHIFSSCCTIHVEAEAEVEFWWSIAPPGGNLNLTPFQHEISHVMQFLQQWNALESDVFAVLPSEIKCGKASCYYEVIENLRLARYNLAYAIGYDFDIRDGQRKQAERNERQRKADDYFQKAIQKKRECQAK